MDLLKQTRGKSEATQLIWLEGGVLLKNFILILYMKLYQIYVHVSLQARAKLSFRARAGAVNDTLDSTVGPGKDLLKKKDFRALWLWL